MPSYYVNTSNLMPVIEDTDYSYKGLGPTIAMTRTYNASESTWHFSYDSTVQYGSCGNSAVVRKGSGQELTYTGTVCVDGEPSPTPVALTMPQGVYDRLTWQGDHWLLAEKETRYTYRYDASPDIAGLYRLTSISDRNGNSVMLAYNTDGKISKITDAANRATTFTYDANKNCIGMITADGLTASYEYGTTPYVSSYGQITKTVDLAGYETTYTYKDGFIRSMNAAGNTTTFNFGWMDGWLRLTSIVDARGQSTTYEVPSTNPLITRVIDPRGKATTYESQASGFTTTVTDALGHMMAITYANGNETAYRDFNGGIRTMEYDSRGNVTRFTDPLGNVYSYAYDSSDNLLSETNPLGDEWKYSYDGKGNLIKTISPLGYETTMTYDNKGQMVGITDANGKATGYVYDDFGNITKITDALGKFTTMTYDALGFHMLSSTDGIGNRTERAYDNNGRVTKIIYPDNTFKSFTYNCCAPMSQTDENNSCTTLTRDGIQYITAVVDPMTNRTEGTYDGNSNLTTITNPLGQTTTHTYDEANRVTRTIDPAGNGISLAYDNGGNLIRMEDKRAKVTHFTYDDNDLLLSLTNPLNQKVTRVRDAAGRTKAVTNARGNVIAFDFDKDGRLTGKSYDGTPVAAYAYDAVGNLTSSTDALGRTSYVYNGRNQVASVGYPGGLSASFAYNDNGNLSTIEYPGGLTVTYDYDNRNRIKTVAWDDVTVSFGYDGVGRVVNEERSNGTRSTYRYDGNGRMVAIDHARGEASFAHMSYQRDRVGMVTREDLNLPLRPNFADRPAAATYDDANQIVTYGDSQYTYDVDGNLTTVAGARSFRASYSPENRLLSLESLGVTRMHAYDGLGNRVRTTEGAETTNHFYDPRRRLLFETDGNGTVKAFYIYRDDRLVGQRSASGASYFYHFDKIGNTLAVTDTGGALAAAYAYDVSGNVVQEKGTLYNPFRYVGAAGVVADGKDLYFMKSRHYDTVTGRFLQRDPIGFAGGANLYAYALNNPVYFTDPEGTCVEPLTFLACAAAVYGGYRVITAGVESLRKARNANYCDMKESVEKGNPNMYDPATRNMDVAARMAQQASTAAEAERGIVSALGTPLGGNGPNALEMGRDALIDQVQSTGQGMIEQSQENQRVKEEMRRYNEQQRNRTP